MNIYVEMERMKREINYLKSLMHRNDIKIYNSRNEITAEELEGGFIGLDRSDTTTADGGKFFVVDNGEVLTIG